MSLADIWTRMSGMLRILVCYRYFRSLSMMESRFPISKDDHHVSMSFTWYDAFRPTKRSEHYSIHFEKACVLFNIGAVLTQQGLGCNRETETGVKEAAKNFRVCSQQSRNRPIFALHDS